MFGHSKKCLMYDAHSWLVVGMNGEETDFTNLGLNQQLMFCTYPRSLDYSVMVTTVSSTTTPSVLCTVTVWKTELCFTNFQFKSTLISDGSLALAHSRCSKHSKFNETLWGGNCVKIRHGLTCVEF